MAQEDKQYCKDGGVCHHECKEHNESCFREACCVPLSDSGLDDNWNPIKPQELTVFDPLALSGQW